MTTQKVLRDRRFLTLKEAAHYLGVSEGTVRRRVAQRKITFYKPEPGGRLQFDPADLEAYIAGGRVEAVDEWEF